MSIGCFLDKNTPPSFEEIDTKLGVRQPFWARLVKFIDTNYQMPGVLSFGGKKYGWNLWYRKSGKSLASLFPQEGGFVVQIVLGKEAVEKALQLSLGEHLGRLLRDTPQLHDGRWLFIPVLVEEDIADIEQLLLVKKKPLRKPGPGKGAQPQVGGVED